MSGFREQPHVDELRGSSVRASVAGGQSHIWTMRAQISDTTSRDVTHLKASKRTGAVVVTRLIVCAHGIMCAADRVNTGFLGNSAAGDLAFIEVGPSRRPILQFIGAIGVAAEERCRVGTRI